MDGESKGFVHGKLTVTGNRFLDPANGRRMIWLEYLKEADLRDNTFDAPLVLYANVFGSVRSKGMKRQAPAGSKETGEELS